MTAGVKPDHIDHGLRSEAATAEIHRSYRARVSEIERTPATSAEPASSPGGHLPGATGPDPTTDPTTEEITEADAMVLALAEARAASDHGDVPIGAVVLVGGRVVAARHNERELTGDPTAHAEVLALRDAASELGTWRLGDATLVVTLEPCAMCAGAIVNARVGRVVFGAADLKAGATGSLYNLLADPRLNHEPELVAGVRADESAELLRSFFATRR